MQFSFEKIKDLSVDLLNYAKFTDLNFIFSDPNEPAREVAELMKPRAEKLGINLKMDLSSDLKTIRLDPDAIHHCLLNLVTNSIDAVLGEDSSGTPKEVLLETTKTEGWGVEYKVTDNGCGMPDEVKEKLFTSFFSTKGATGTGLGLMITKKVVDAHEGVIQSETEEGVGSVFTIRLPERTQDHESNS
jgi:signal transduction histidine kinase